MKLIIVHYHYRSGGVRRVIELAAPYLARILRPRIEEIVLVGGQAPEVAWLDRFRELVQPCRSECLIDTSLGYFSEQLKRPEEIGRQVNRVLTRLFDGEEGKECVVWAHNLSLLRNVLLARELFRVCEQREIPLVTHHHDWWFDSRWERWPELRCAGVRTLNAAARCLFDHGNSVRHATISSADAGLMEENLPGPITWMPNPSDRPAPPVAAQVRRARKWLDRQYGLQGAPFWVLPCRLLRRKNVAEALLLTRWLRPEAYLITTAGVSSDAEQPYAEKFAGAARRHGWPLRLSVLGGPEDDGPSVSELVAASEAVLLTSVQEGFGLPYIEAAAASRPLVARSLSNIAPDLAHFGFRFPQCYDELMVAPTLFDGEAERRRQAALYRSWLKGMPARCRKLASEPALLRGSTLDTPAAFSRLTLTAQIEVLTQPVEESWAACSPLNPFLKTWRERARTGQFRVSPWPRSIERWLGGEVYAARFQQALGQKTELQPSGAAAVECQEAFLRWKLDAEFLYPLLWSRET